MAQQQLTLDVDRSAKQLIAKEGFDPQGRLENLRYTRGRAHCF